MAGFDWNKYQKDEGQDDSGFDWNKHEKVLPEISELESGARGAVDAATFGLAAKAEGGVRALLEKVKGNPEEFNKLYSKLRDESRKSYKEAEEANPASYGAGELAGNIGTMFIPGLNAAKGAKLASVMGKAALQGGISSLGHNDKDINSLEDLKDVAMDTGIGTVMGAGGGALGHGAGKVVGKGIQKTGELLAKAKEPLKEVAENMSARALGLERGTIKKLGRDQVRKVGRYGLDEGVVKPLSSVEDMIERNQEVKQKAGQAMGEVYDAVDQKGASTFNPLDTAAKVDEKIGGFWKSPINRAETNQLENTLEAITMRGDKPIPLREAQLLKEELGKVANWRNKLNPTDKEIMAREAWGVVSDSLDEATDQGAKTIGSEGLLKTLKEARRLYSGSKTADELLENKYAREYGNKVFGLTDNIAVAGRGPIEGAKFLAAKKIAEYAGPQTIAGGADMLANKLAKAPELFGKYAPILQEAARKGTQSLALTYYLLQKKDPEFGNMMNQINSQGE